MSAPDTNLSKQKRRHRFPLVGMAVATAIGVLLILFWVSDLFVAPADDGVDAETPAISTPQTNGDTAVSPDANDG